MCSTLLGEVQMPWRIYFGNLVVSDCQYDWLIIGHYWNELILIIRNSVYGWIFWVHRRIEVVGAKNWFNSSHEKWILHVLFFLLFQTVEGEQPTFITGDPGFPIKRENGKWHCLFEIISALQFNSGIFCRNVVVNPQVELFLFWIDINL